MTLSALMKGDIVEKQEAKLFEAEEGVLKEAVTIIESGKYRTDPLLGQYRILVEHFEKLLKETEKIVRISDRQQEYLCLIQDHLQLEIENRIKAEEKLRHLVAIDSLTGAYNRGVGLAIFENMLKTLKRNQDVLSICYIDVNGLKYVNDNFGHFEGDELLVLVCQYIKGVIRENDILCRLGGDEFMIILPRCTKENAEAIIRRISANIDRDKEKKLKPYDISFSFGIIQVDPDNEVSVDTIIEMADMKMYQYKQKFKSGVK